MENRDSGPLVGSGDHSEALSSHGNDILNLMALTSLDDGIAIPASSYTAIQGHALNDPRSEQLDEASKQVYAFLLKHEPEFVRVTEFRNRGWFENKTEGDAFFKNQRDRADNADYEGRKRFYEMMVQIAKEMHLATRAFDVEGTPSGNMKVLDICCAPGGYMEAILRHNPHAKVFGITLPEDLGGHPLILDKAKLSGLSLIDVTLLLKEYTNNKPIPTNYPKKSIFLSTQPFKFHQFDLVFCDGKVLRTHQRPTYREVTEATRLTYSQLILALQRVRHGGTLVMLLHKADLWPSILILYTFSKFSKVQVFKPAKKHATRSSFYMIAKDIQPGSEEAKTAVREWKDVWWKATFGGPDAFGMKEEPDQYFVLRVLEEFGDRLVELGRPIWRIQADALSKTDYAGRSSANFESIGSKEGHIDGDKMVQPKEDVSEH